MGNGELSPFKKFGQRIKVLRERAKESLLEVSGAVEIDQKTLEQIEAGNQLPDEEILSLLMSHFNVSEPDAVKLWELAGYGKNAEKGQAINEEQLLKQIMMVIPFDNRVAFVDTAHINADDNGVVINFALSAGSVQPQTVARVGMSMQYAEQFLNQLNKTLSEAKQPKVQRALPAPKQKRKSDKKNPA